MRLFGQSKAFDASRETTRIPGGKSADVSIPTLRSGDEPEVVGASGLPRSFWSEKKEDRHEQWRLYDISDIPILLADRSRCRRAAMDWQAIAEQLAARVRWNWARYGNRDDARVLKQLDELKRVER